jgi:caa(3)-type oxidase subunit IV
MINALKNSAHRAWVVLIVATAITWYLGEVGAAGTLSIVAMLGIAFVKGRLVILDFMELRNAPVLWRALLEGWLILVSSLILLAYWISLK